MVNINNEYILTEITNQFGEKVYSSYEPYGLLTIEFDKNSIKDLLSFLYNHKELQMQFLTDVCGTHYPDVKGKEIGVIYHIHSLINNVRLRVKCYMPIENPSIDSATFLFRSANWQERETFDFYGVNFVGHPNLRRILNADEMDYFPMRKEYPLEDGTRTDKDDSYFGR
jgi:NADH-quinone oxidoreductase subunit C